MSSSRRFRRSRPDGIYKTPLWKVLKNSQNSLQKSHAVDTFFFFFFFFFFLRILQNSYYTEQRCRTGSEFYCPEISECIKFYFPIKVLHWFICWVIHDESRTTARTNPILNFRSTHSIPLYIFFHEQVSLSNHKILKRCSDIAETLLNIKNISETRIFEQYSILFLLKPFLRKKNQLIESIGALQEQSWEKS